MYQLVWHPGVTVFLNFVVTIGVFPALTVHMGVDVAARMGADDPDGGVTLRLTTVSDSGARGTIVLDKTIVANGVGAFEATVDLTDAVFSAGSIHTLDALGSFGNAGAAGFVIQDKDAAD